ncbi:hypothetical protein [Microvirga puerhi]|uniref:Uncharacterized protein n=1 Tax=Microvirga puerhi TaxID=2876078 RepID=A0ABS7VMV8_9HYPH|nr:hypothetical protein [Microvirga puerhi]MBZ6076283.1 hypothetical protein [Microvirga puerhi]
MFGADIPSVAGNVIAILFPPPIVPLIDAFRSLEVLSEHYDVHVLDGPEGDMARFIDRDTARAIVSDAMLLAFALSRQRGGPLSHRPLRSRQGSVDEYCVLALIGAARDPGSELAFEAAAALGIGSVDFTLSIAIDLLRQIDQGGLFLEQPSLAEFRAIVSENLLLDGGLTEDSIASSFLN